MGIGERFNVFCNNLTIKDSGTISTRYKAITKRLNVDFRNTDSETAHSLYVGSYGRGTAINGFSDLDMIYTLPYSVYETYNDYNVNGQSALLQAVRASIKKTYSTTDISADGQVVVVPFTDRITFEVVPAFVNKDKSFTFPNANNGGSWKTTNPRPEIQAISDVNKLCNENLIWLCRMTRAWKQYWGVPMGGLLIDTLAYQFIQTWANRDKSFLYYDFLSRDFFLYLAGQDEKQEKWRAPGSQQYVYGKDFQYKAKRCYNIALEAIKYDVDNNPNKANLEWRKIYGPDYPQ